VNRRKFFHIQLLLLSLFTTVLPVAAAPGEPQVGKALYEHLCVSCHGLDGQGGRMAGMLPVPPRNLADHGYMSTRSDQQLFDVINKGGTAVGLSNAMTAFGNQMTAQQIWDTIAYIRTIKANSQNTTQQPIPPPTGNTTAPATGLAMARLRLSLWPEYDDPRVLVMLRGEMTPREAFPTSLVLPLPKGAEIVGAGMISEHNELLLHPHQVQSGDTHDSIQLNLPVPRFFLEFYYNPFTTNDPQKRFTYAAPTSYPIETLQVDIQQPLKATDFTVTPSPMERLSDNQGFTYYQFTYHNVPQNQSHLFHVAYTKTTAAPSVQKQQPTPQEKSQGLARPNTTLVAFTVLAGAIVLFLGWAYFFRWRQIRTAPLTNASVSLPSLADTLTTLLQTSAPPSDTAPTISPTPTTINFCTNCGRKLLPEDRFCAGCGKPITGV